LRRLSLISGLADRELDAIRRTVRVFEDVASAAEVIAALQAHTAKGSRIDVIDLIGHSRRHGFLRLGIWQLDDSPQVAATMREEIRPSLAALGVSAIRLLGCSTAAKDRGLAAMRRIEHATGRPVFGTRRFISKRDYGPEGFISDDALVGLDGRPVARPDPVGFLAGGATTVALAANELTAGPRLCAEQPLLPVNEAVADELLRYVDGTRSWVLPGLLAEPAMIVLWSRANSIYRLDILLEGRVVRGYGAYPDDEHGRLFRVRDPDALNEYLESVTRPHNESQDRSL
jgi:hypothetical protein